MPKSRAHFSISQVSPVGWKTSVPRAAVSETSSALLGLVHVRDSPALLFDKAKVQIAESLYLIINLTYVFCRHGLTTILVGSAAKGSDVRRYTPLQSHDPLDLHRAQPVRIHGSKKCLLELRHLVAAKANAGKWSARRCCATAPRKFRYN
jgi:hypothetical protein